jgi:hypothetical protein
MICLINITFANLKLSLLKFAIASPNGLNPVLINFPGSSSALSIDIQSFVTTSCFANSILAFSSGDFGALVVSPVAGVSVPGAGVAVESVASTLL